MATRLKCFFWTTLTSQIILILVYYSLNDKIALSQRWTKGELLTNGLKNYIYANSTIANFLPFSIWDMMGWDDSSEDESSNETLSAGKDVDLVSREAYMTSRSSMEATQAKHEASTKPTTNISPTKLPENQHFQRTDNKSAWVYSAFFDYVAAQQGNTTVRVFGIFWKDLFGVVFCNLSLANSSVVQVMAKAVNLPETYGSRHIAGHIKCDLPADVRPTHVSISFRKNATAVNRLKIIYPGNRVRNFTVCYSVLHSGFGSAAQLIQSLEMNRILGAEHFMVYLYSISPAVDQILRRYQQDGLVTVIPWQVPTRDVHYYGQMAALNDCSYRNRNVSRFLVVVDTDEFILPRNSLTWMEMLDTISPEEYDVSAFVHPSDKSSKNLTTTECFRVKSSFVNIRGQPDWAELPTEFQFSNEEKKNISKFRFLTLSQFWRSKEIFPPESRTKYISRPELVTLTGIHASYTTVSGRKCTYVNDSLALVHHFRPWYRTKWTRENMVMDLSFFKFKNQLYPALIKQVQRFPSIFK